MEKIRILVVEDSLTARKRLVEVISSDREAQVVGEAADGKTAIDLCRNLRPDVITLDMQLPVLSGLAVTQYVMAHCPTPILIVSSSTNRGELFKTYDALAAGAVDVLDKPKSDFAGWEEKLISTIKLVSRIHVIRHVRGPGPDMSQPPLVPLWAVHPGEYRVVALGASTGGPAAVLEILQDLPANFPLPVLVVIHIGESFGTHLPEWLDSRSSLAVSYAVDGECLPAVGQARVILAPPGKHLVVSQGRLLLTDYLERHSCKPSVDVLFESVGAELRSQSIACLLTGMGRDGAEGLLAVRHAGGRTFAQDEKTSSIFGMPREAIRLGAAEEVIGLPDIAPALIALARPLATTQYLTLKDFDQGQQHVSK